MKSIWTDHIPDRDKKQEFEKYLRNSGILLNRLIDILDKDIEMLNRRDVSEDYTSPAWAMQQADRIGQYKALIRIRKLLDLKET